MNLIGKLPKNGFNEHFRYKFLKEADLVEKLSELLAERKLFITSSTTGKSIETVEWSKMTKTGVVTTKMGIIRVGCTFHDGESGKP